MRTLSRPPVFSVMELIFDVKMVRFDDSGAFATSMVSAMVLFMRTWLIFCRKMVLVALYRLQFRIVVPFTLLTFRSIPLPFPRMSNPAQ